MAVLENTQTESTTGFKKTIDKDSEAVILNIVQVALYQFPFKSMIRETVSNALDAIKEKRAAKDIISDPKKLTDYYEDIDGDIYNSSKFDINYYNTKWLDVFDKVIIEYHNLPNGQRDVLKIKDTGVGLGGRRLEKFFVPGYSSKRLNKYSLGRYGIGNKSPLATGIGVYRLVSHYNGMKFVFDIYEDKIDPVIGKFAEDGSLNPYIEFTETSDTRGNSKVYYEPTNEFNSVEIIVEIKKHNKNAVIEGIKSQLMYFKEDIAAYDVYDNHRNPITFKSEVFHEDNDIILSNSNYYHRPHFVLNGVSYGLIDFRELELDNRFGNIGLKFRMEDLDVSPSRETVTYSQKTREAVQAKYTEISRKVETMISEKLKTTDFLEWIKTVNKVLYAGGDSSDKVLYTLSNLIDKHALKFTFKKDEDIINYYSSIKDFTGKFLNVEHVFLETSYRNTKGNIKRKDADNAAVFNNACLFQFENASTPVTSYLLKTNGNNLCLIRPNFPYDDLTTVAIDFVNKNITYDDFIDAGNEIIDEKVTDDSAKAAAYKLQLGKAGLIIKHLLTSSKCGNYSKINVPDDFSVDSDAPEDTGVTVYEQILKARKQNNKFIIGCAKLPRNQWNPTFSNIEVSYEDIKGAEIVYGFSADADNLTNLSKAIGVYNTLNKVAQKVHQGNKLLAYSDDLIVAKVAQNSKRYLSANDLHLDEWGMDVINGKFQLHPILRTMYSYKYATDKLKRIGSYTKNLNFIYPDITDYTSKVRDSDSHSFFINFDLVKTPTKEIIDKAYQLQILKHQKPNMEEEAWDDLKVEYLGIDLADEVEDIDIFPAADYEMVNKIVDFDRVYGALLSILCSEYNYRTSSKALLDDIRDIIANKKDQLEFEHPTILI